MNIPLQHVPPKEHLKALLEAGLPQYEVSFRQRFINVKKSGFIGATVVMRKDKIIVNGNFPTTGSMLVYILLLFGTGILIGLIIWAVVWRNGQNQVRDEVAAVLRHQLGLPAVATVA